MRASFQTTRGNDERTLIAAIRVVGYVDPGSGLLAWQLLVAAVVGLVFYLKKSRDFLKKMARKLLRRGRS